MNAYARERESIALWVNENEWKDGVNGVERSEVAREKNEVESRGEISSKRVSDEKEREPSGVE